MVVGKSSQEGIKGEISQGWQTNQGQIKEKGKEDGRDN